MKRIICFLTVISLIFAVSCGKKDDVKVLTSEVTQITNTTAVVKGMVESNVTIGEQGVCYSSMPECSVEDSIVTSATFLTNVSCKLTGLQPETKYYARVYAIVNGVTYYGDELSFTTLNQTDPDPEPDPEPKILFVLNEGTYTYANSSLSYYDLETGAVENNIFYRVNSSPIGDVGQSLAQNDGHLYIVVNNSNYIYKTDVNTIQYEAQLTDFNSPRYMKFISDDKAYVTDIMARGVWVINPETMTHTKFINTGKPTENMVLVGNNMYVTNWSKYYAQDIENNTVQIIDTDTDQKTGEIEVGIEPNSMVLDKYNNLWVMCGGGYLDEWHDTARLYCINPADNQIIKSFTFPDIYPMYYPGYLNIDNTGSVLYYIDNGKFYKMSVDAAELPTQPFISPGAGGNFYNSCINPHNGDIYISDAKGYITSGEVSRYTSDGTFVTSFTVGLVPSFMMFKKE